MNQRVSGFFEKEKGHDSHSDEMRSELLNYLIFLNDYHTEVPKLESQQIIVQQKLGKLENKQAKLSESFKLIEKIQSPQLKQKVQKLYVGEKLTIDSKIKKLQELQIKFALMLQGWKERKQNWIDSMQTGEGTTDSAKLQASN